jgi:hypothetical protein
LLVAAFWYLLVTSLLMWGQYYVERYFARGATNRPLPPTPLQKLRKLVRDKLSGVKVAAYTKTSQAEDKQAEGGAP